MTYCIGIRLNAGLVFLSDSRDPRKGTDHGGSEVYAVYRHQLYASRVFDRPLGTGLVKDYALTLGFDANRNNNFASAKKRALVLENRALKASVARAQQPGMRILGQSPAMVQLRTPRAAKWRYTASNQP